MYYTQLTSSARIQNIFINSNYGSTYDYTYYTTLDINNLMSIITCRQRVHCLRSYGRRVLLNNNPDVHFLVSYHKMYIWRIQPSCYELFSF